MSYDVSLYIDAGNGPVSVGSLDANYTYNLGDFIEEVLGKRLTQFNGEDACDLRDAIVDGLDRIDRQSWDGERSAGVEWFKRFEPDNGWGTVFGAIVFLNKIAVECAKCPNAKVSVS